jgi:hypothetical protein
MDVLIMHLVLASLVMNFPAVSVRVPRHPQRSLITYPPPSGQGIGSAWRQTAAQSTVLLPLGTYQKGGLQWLDNT